MLLKPTQILWKWFVNILLSLDETVNAVFLGSPHESISARLGRNYPGSILYRVVNSLFFWQCDHCRGALDNEPADYEKDAIAK